MSDVIYSREAFEAAAQRLKSAPELLNAADIAQLQLIDPQLAERGILARSKALRPPPVPAARLDVDAIADTLVGIIVANIKPLEQRIAALETRPAVKYCGTFEESTGYPEGSMTTRSGGLWVATRATTATPGTDESGWLLVVKKGQAER